MATPRWQKIMLGIKAFREAYTNADLVTAKDYWSSFDGRQMRYDLLWAYYQGNAYRTAIHHWADAYRGEYGMYRYTRDLYNPMATLGTFYETYVWGGYLDPNAGDDNSTAIPISTENDALRLAIARLWRDSNWSTRRNIAPLWGAVMGDVFLGVYDDTEREKVSLRIVHPSMFEEVERDAYGNIQGYTIRYKRKDDLSELEVEYSEEVFRNGNNILYKLAKNGTPYAWGNESAEWEVAYGFVPMVQIQHHSVGMDWGASEGQSKLQLFRELDDAVSLLGDQVRKVINPFWLFTGTTKPTTQPTAVPVGAGLTPVAQSGREELAAMYVPNPDVKAMPLIGNINIADTIGLINLHLDQLERAYPELQLYKLHEGSSGTLSGTAVRYRQAEAENKVQERRGGYDNALVRAQQMAVAIGGFRGYDGYEGFGLDSYASGALDHSIAKRPVFARDIQDDLAVDKARAEVVKILTDAGGNLAQAARLAGYTEDEAMLLIQVETGMEQ